MIKMRNKIKGWSGGGWTFSIRDVMEIIGADKADVPNAFMDKLDLPLDEICHDKLRKDIAGNILLFDVFPRKGNRIRFENYSKQGNIFIVSSDEYYSENGDRIPTIIVKDAYDAYCALGKYIKKSFPMPTIGITGSVGKTTTSMLLELIFAEKYNVYSGGPGGKNYNVPVEMVYQMIKRYSSQYNVHLQECGGGRSNLVKEAAELLDVDAFGITKISKTHHIDKYKDTDDLIADKTSFDRIHKSSAFGVVNADDEVLADYPFSCPIITYGIDNKEADYIGDNIRQNGEFLEFDILHGGDRHRFSINIVGKHNVYNALMAYALAKQFGISDEQIQIGFSKYRSGRIRQNICKVAGRILYIDCFNVCSDSIKACVDTLREITPGDGGRRIAVLGGENALGTTSYDVNFKTGTELSDSDIDHFVFFGPKEPTTLERLNYYGNGKALYDGASTVLPNEKIQWIDDLKKLAAFLSNESKIGDVILFKGIYRLPMFAAIDMAFGTNYLIYNVNFKGKNVKDEHYFGSYYQEIDGINLIKPLIKELHLPDTISGKSVVRIGKNVFKGKTNLELVTIGNKCKTIGEGCFRDCTNIRKIVIPKSLVYIEKEAFSGCEKIETINLESIKHISEKAFENCRSLDKIYLSNQCGTIEKDAFIGCPNLTVYAPANSYAQKYALENHIDFVET